MDGDEDCEEQEEEENVESELKELSGGHGSPTLIYSTKNLKAQIMLVIPSSNQSSRTSLRT